MEVRGKAMVAGILEQGSLKPKYGISPPMPDLVRGTDWEPKSQGILVPGVGVGAAPETMGSPFSHSKWGRAVSQRGNTHPDDAALFVDPFTRKITGADRNIVLYIAAAFARSPGG